MTRPYISRTVRALALGTAVALALAACESTTEPTARKGTPRPVDQLVLGTWVLGDAGGQAQYLHLAEDGTAAVWGGHQSITELDDLVFDRTWKIKDGTKFDVAIEGLGVLTYDPQRDVLLDPSGQAYRRTQIGSFT